MHSSDESEKKMNKTKSFNQPFLAPSTKVNKNEPGKRKSFDLNDGIRSMDLAYRLKKSKLVNGESASSSPTILKRRAFPPDLYMDVSSTTTCPETENASMMSMNFSHYELMRNLSNSLCDSDEAFSSTTCSARINSPDRNIKNEHLERYFRSVEMWAQKRTDGGTSGIHLRGPDK